jgi:hypothetical protein
MAGIMILPAAVQEAEKEGGGIGGRYILQGQPQKAQLLQLHPIS